jgi:hypothetical protein
VVVGGFVLQLPFQSILFYDVASQLLVGCRQLGGALCYARLRLLLDMLAVINVHKDVDAPRRLPDSS